MSRVAVLVVNYFSADQVDQLLDSVVEHTSHPERLTISIVDNSESDDELARLADRTVPYMDRFGAVIVTAAPGNLGYGAGNNLALDRARALGDLDAAVVINPDVRVLEGDIYEELLRLPDGAIYSARTLHDGKRLAGVGSISVRTSRSRQLVESETLAEGSLVYPAGHFLAMSASMWDLSEGFDPDFFLYGEELDLTLRLGLPASQIRVLPSLLVEHDSGGTTGSARGEKSSLTYRNATRSMVLLYRKHRRLTPWLLPMLAARVGLAVGAAVRGRRAEARAIVSGIRDGLTHTVSTPAGGGRSL